MIGSLHYHGKGCTPCDKGVGVNDSVAPGTVGVLKDSTFLYRR